MVVKIPMTVEGLKAVKVLSAEGIKTNVTLIFTAMNPPDRANADRTGDTPLAAQNLNTAGGDTPAFSGLRD